MALSQRKLFAVPSPEPKSALLESLALLRDSEHLGIVTGEAHRIVEANDAYLGIIGLTRREFESQTIDWRELTPMEYAARDEQGLVELREYGVCVPFEKEYLRRDGTRVPVLLGAVRLQSEPLQWAGWVINVDKYRAGIAAQDRNRALEERTRLVNLLAHEINNPLSIIVNALFLLRNHPSLDSHGQQLVQESTRAVERVAETVRAILAAAEDKPLRP